MDQNDRTIIVRSTIMVLNLAPVFFVLYGACRDFYMPSFDNNTNDNNINDNNTKRTSNNTKTIRSELMPKVDIDGLYD